MFYGPKKIRARTLFCNMSHDSVFMLKIILVIKKLRDKQYYDQFDQFQLNISCRIIFITPFKVNYPQVPIMRKSKPYTCPICGNTFAWRSNMNRHILHLHKIDHKQLNKLLLSGNYFHIF